MIKKTNRDKLLAVLKRRKTYLGTKELAMKAGVNYNSARRELCRLFNSFYADRRLESDGSVSCIKGIALN